MQKANKETGFGSAIRLNKTVSQKWNKAQ